MSIRGKYPNITWRKMSGMRDKMIHEYFGVDIEILWKTIKEDVPPLENMIRKVLEDLSIQTD
ncbi:MAG: HepT-like ribonuclease domain-containing protein [Thermoproteota archaeon]